MRAARLRCSAPCCSLGTLLATSAAARPPGAPKGLRGFELRPNEAVDAHVLANARVRVEPGPRRGLLRVRARDEPDVRRQLGLLVERLERRRRPGESCRAVTITATCAGRRGVDGDGSATERQDGSIAPIRIPATSVNLVLPWFTGKPYALYAHVRAVTTPRRDRVEHAVRLQHALGVDTRCRRPREARPRPLDARRGRDRVRGLVPGHPQGHSRRTRTSPTSASSTRSTSRTAGGELVHWRVRAGAAGRRSPPERPACSLVRPLEPDVRDDEPGVGDGQAPARAPRSRTSVSTELEGRAHQLMPALTFGGDTGIDGRAVPALPRLRLHRPRLRERRLPRLRRRRPGVRAPHQRPAQAPDEPGELDIAARGVLPSGKIREREDVHGRRDARRRERDVGRGRIRVRRSTSRTSTRRRRATSGRSSRSGSASTDGRDRSRTTTPSRRRTRASRARGELRQGVSRPAITAVGSAVRLGPLAEGSPARAGRPTRRSSTRRRSSRGDRSSARPPTRSQWSRTKYPWRARGSAMTLRDVVGAPARPGHLVLPRPRTQRRAGRHAGDDLVGAGRRQGRPPTFRITGG